ncbi:MAG TPA: NepR family anti-sigma factor [Azospirillaceae bacterium]|nr:NepR family anti-sigma factor [Azospirillaceae bacterium]
MSDINAYLDGALTEAERREMEQAIREDPEAAALIHLHRRHVEELHRLYDSVLEEPIPERMLSLLRRARER